jgi:hypothetical protein
VARRRVWIDEREGSEDIGRGPLGFGDRCAVPSPRFRNDAVR